MRLFVITFLCSILIAAPEKAPTFFLHTLDDKTFFLSEEIKKEKPIVLSFFATWCGPCRKEMPVLDSLSKVFTDIEFFLVNVSNLVQGDTKLKEDPVMVQKMLEDLNVDLPVLMDKYAMTAEKYGATTLPLLVIIDKKGNIILSKTGYKKGDELELIDVLEGLNR